MNRILTVLFAALEALLVVGVGIVIPLLPLTVLWGSHYGFAPDWAIFWRTAADVWLVGHGTDITLTLDPLTAKAAGVGGTSVPFVLSIAALGFSFITVLLGRRAGRRLAETDHRLLAELVALAAVALLSFGIAVSATAPLAKPSLVQGTVLPTLVFAIGLFIARLSPVRRWDAATDSLSITPPTAPSPLSRWVAGWRPDVRAVVGGALRGGGIAAAGVITVASIAVMVLLVANYAQIITLYEGLHSGAIGGAALTIAQIMVLPNLVIWAASWLVGPGFALGTGSMVSPLATAVGPLPAVPVLGALPQGDLPFAFVGLLVPVVAGYLSGALIGGRITSLFDRTNRTLLVVVTGAATGIVAGTVLGLLAWASAGGVGPGRLQQVGPDPLLVGGFAALEIGIAAILGMASTVRGGGEETRAPDAH